MLLSKSSKTQTLVHTQGEPPPITAASVTTQNPHPRGSDTRTDYYPQQPTSQVKPELDQGPTACARVGDEERPKRKKKPTDSAFTRSPHSNVHESYPNRSSDEHPRSVIASGNADRQNVQRNRTQAFSNSHRVASTAQQDSAHAQESRFRSPALCTVVHLSEGPQSSSSTASEPSDVGVQQRTRRSAKGIEPVSTIQEETRRYNTRNKGAIKKEA